MQVGRFGVCSLLLVSVAAAQTDPGEIAGTLSPQLTVTLPGDYVAAGIGLQGVEQASIAIDSIPEGAEIVGGVLVWGLLDDESREEHSRIAINGTPVRGRLAGSNGGCWRSTRSFVYRAKLTPVQLGQGIQPIGDPLPPPSGNGEYVLSNFAGAPTVMQGATLFLIYRQEGARVRDIVVYDGNVAPDAFPPPPFFRDSSMEIAGFLAQSPVEATSTFVVGNADPNVRDLPFFITDNGSYRSIGFSPLDSSDGPSWDTETIDLGGAIAPGDETATACLRHYAVRVGRLYTVDCTFWAAQVTSVTSSRPADPHPGSHFEDRTLLADGSGR